VSWFSYVLLDSSESSQLPPQDETGTCALNFPTEY